MTDQSEQRRHSRRTIAKGAAWAVPAVPLVLATPAYAISGGPPDVLVGTACKLPGNSNTGPCQALFANCTGLDPSKAYALPLLVTNNTDKPIVLKPIITISSTGLPLTVTCIDPTYCTPIAVGSSVKVIAYGNSNDSANTEITVALTIPWGHDCADTDHPPIVIEGIVVDSFPPCSSRVPFPTGSPTCDPPFYQTTP
jgi:hypothetical protein